MSIVGHFIDGSFPVDTCIERMKPDIIVLPLPPALNHTYGFHRGKMFKVPKARDWEQEALALVKYKYKRRDTITGDVFCALSIFHSRDRDIDGSIKITLDLLEKAGLIVNDRQIKFLNVQMFKVKENTRIEIEIRRINAARN